jgi:membrane-associated phospholipid phosphatase
VAISRVMTTLHYFSDIVFGAYLAFVVVYSVYTVFDFARKQLEKLVAKIDFPFSKK